MAFPTDTDHSVVAASLELVEQQQSQQPLGSALALVPGRASGLELEVPGRRCASAGVAEDERDSLVRAFVAAVPQVAPA